MSLKLGDSLKTWKFGILFIDLPHVAFTLSRDHQLPQVIDALESTLLFPATKHEPSEARLTDLIGTSPAGVSPRRISE